VGGTSRPVMRQVSFLFFVIIVVKIDQLTHNEKTKVSKRRRRRRLRVHPWSCSVQEGLGTDGVTFPGEGVVLVLRGLKSKNALCNIPRRFVPEWG
jgi:hypothetical protein